MRANYVVLAGLAVMLSGCGFWPASHDQHFTVTGEIPPKPTPALGFHTADVHLNDAMAKDICADGYEKLDQTTLPAQDDGRDSEEYYQWHVHCTSGFLSLF